MRLPLIVFRLGQISTASLETQREVFFFAPEEASPTNEGRRSKG